MGTFKFSMRMLVKDYKKSLFYGITLNTVIIQKKRICRSSSSRPVFSAIIIRL